MSTKPVLVSANLMSALSRDLLLASLFGHRDAIHFLQYFFRRDKRRQARPMTLRSGGQSRVTKNMLRLLSRPSSDATGPDQLSCLFRAALDGK